MEAMYYGCECRKVVYIAHPLAGNGLTPDEMRAQLADATAICRELAKQHPKLLILSPLHALGFYDIMEREAPLRDCEYMIRWFADELWVYGDWKSSEGCKREIAWAEDAGIPVVFKSDGSELFVRTEAE